MKKAEAVSLLRRFVENRCTKEEIIAAIALLEHGQHREWYGELMDEMHSNGAIEPVDISDEQVLKNFHALESRLDDEVVNAKIKRLSWPMFFRLASIVTGIIMVAGLAIYDMKMNQRIRYETRFGEIRTVHLPDGSQVVLNGNTTLEYWAKDGGTRSVELLGEAYFSVRKMPDHRKFVLIMPETGVIEVLGTEFNVNHRATASRIMLRSGSIRLTPENGGGKEIIMKPGELVEMQAGMPQLINKKADPGLHDAWTSRKLVFENTPLREITRMLTDAYGLEVTVDDPRLLDKKLSGTAPIQDIDIFLKALSGSFDLQIGRRKNKVTIQAR
jgi:ferric-dicitrate binding protein FerR (iron transport regulator)